EFVELPLDAELAARRFEHAQPLGHHFLADAVTGDDGDAKLFHGESELKESSASPRPGGILRQAALLAQTDPKHQRNGRKGTSMVASPLPLLRPSSCHGVHGVHASRHEQKKRAARVAALLLCATAPLRRGHLLGGLDRALARVLLAEALDPTRGVHDLLLAGVEGMALRAHFHVQLVPTERGLRVPPVAATADDGNRRVIGMYLRFHTASVPMVSEKGAHYP